MDGISLRGRLRITRVRGLGGVVSAAAMQSLIRYGHAEVVLEADNMVVDLGLSVLSRLVGFGLSTPNVTNGTQTFPVTDVNDLAINAMTFGNLAAPVAPIGSDFALEDLSALTTVVPVVTYPGNATIRWSGVIPAGVFTGDQVTEETLFTANGALFARTTFAPQAITAGFGLQLDHDFTFTRV